jgi:hypothetical protein
VIFTAFIIAANYYLYVGGWSNVVNKWKFKLFFVNFKYYEYI